MCANMFQINACVCMYVCIISHCLGHYSACCNVYYSYTAPTSPPANVSAVVLNSNTISVSWNALPVGSANGIIRKYLVSVTVLESQENWSVETPHTTITLSELHPYYTFTIQVAAHTIGPGPFSHPQTLKTLQDGELAL